MKHTGVSRRDFIKAGSMMGATAMVGAGAAAGGLRLSAPAEEGKRPSHPFSFLERTYDTIDEAYDISPSYQRFDEKNIMFCRAAWDSPSGMPEGMFISFLAKDMGMVPQPHAGMPAYMPYDHALHVASWWGHDIGAPMSKGGARSTGILTDWNVYANPTRPRYQFESKDRAASIVKRAARFLGADLVGIAPFDERWVYSHWYNILPFAERQEEPIYEQAVFPFQPKTVISIAFEMDYDGIKCGGNIADAAVGLEYTHMAEVGARIANFLNNLGYRAIPAGNDTGLSVPIAAQAGLGELGRNGILITPEYGPRIRLAKVFTDLDVTIDRPMSFGVKEFCLRCKKCADLCPSGAISKKIEPTRESDTGVKSSSSGVTKWYHNGERCMAQWDRGSVSCATCVAVCPFNKLQTWNHDAAKAIATLPVGRDIARQLDDLFGYGGDGQPTSANADHFWNKKA